MTQVYTLSTMLFFLNRLHEVEPLNEADRRLVRSITLQLIAGQCTDGRWFYGAATLSREAEEALLEKLKINTFKPTVTVWGSRTSITQFAILALWGSRRHQIPVRPSLLAAAASFRKSQHDNGSWHYYDGSCHHSNTCAGLLALAMENALREGDDIGRASKSTPADKETDERIEKGFTFLAQAVGRTNNDPAAWSKYGTYINADSWGDAYFFWCLERVAVIYNKSDIKGKDWYSWGVDVLLQKQRKDGSWRDFHGDVADTCFALLFLTRENLAKDLTENIRMRGGKAAIP